MSIRGKLVALLAGDKVGTFIKCGKCGSAFITYSDVEVKTLENYKSVSYLVKCNSCNSSAAVKELWK